MDRFTKQFGRGSALAGFLCAAAPLAAQSPIQAPTCVFAFPELAENDSHWVGALSAYLNSFGVSMVEDRAFESLAGSKIGDALPNIGKLGYLVEFHVALSRSTELPIKKLVFVEDHGIGETPVATLAQSTSEGAISPVAGDGFAYSPEDSYFIWFKNGPNGPAAQCISNSVASALIQDVRLIRDSEKLFDDVRRANRSVVFAELARVAQERASDRALAARLRELADQRSRAEKRRAEINANLAKALEEAQRGNNLNMMLQTLSGLISLAQAVQTAQVALNDSSVDFSGATSPDDVVIMSKNYTVRAQGRVATYRSEMTVQDAELASSTAQLIDGLSAAGVKRELLPKMP